jgi:hypothetical protein
VLKAASRANPSRTVRPKKTTAFNLTHIVCIAAAIAARSAKRRNQLFSQVSPQAVVVKAQWAMFKAFCCLSSSSQSSQRLSQHKKKQTNLKLLHFFIVRFETSTRWPGLFKLIKGFLSTRTTTLQAQALQQIVSRALVWEPRVWRQVCSCSLQRNIA